MLNLVKCYNSTYEDERALYDKDKDMLIMEKGDTYHDKICEKIEGFIYALDYLGIEYKLDDTWVEVTPNEDLFETLGFEICDCE